MCNFITGVLDASADTGEFRALVAKYRLSFAPLHSPHIAKQLRPHERYFHVTRSYCDCGTNLAGVPKLRRLDASASKLRAKGWSQAKIDRWIASKGPRARRGHAGDGDLTHEQWLSFLDEALRLHACRYVGLLMHMYKHSTDDEDFTILERVTTTMQDLRDASHRWREDVLYTIVAPRAG